MPNLALRNFRSWKLAKKGDFRIFFDQFLGFTLKRVPEIDDSHILWKPFGTKFMTDGKTEMVFLLILHWVSFPTKKDQ